MHSANNSNTFLAYFNQIDKYLSYILGVKKYVPYHERITMISGGKYRISSFVKGVEGKLRYFGDLRNQLVHGFRLDNRHYVHVSDHAIHEITTMHDTLTKPKTLADVSNSSVVSADSQDTLSSTLEHMKQMHKKYLPVVDGESFIGVLSFEDILAWLVGKSDHDVQSLSVADVDVTYAQEYAFVSSELSVYEAQDLLTSTDTQVLLITKNGADHESIISAVSIHELKKLQKPSS